MPRPKKTDEKPSKPSRKRVSKTPQIQDVKEDSKNLFPHSQFPIRVEYTDEQGKHILFFQNMDHYEKQLTRSLKSIKDIKVMRKSE